MANFNLPADYATVPERIADFRAKHPDGVLRPANPEKPFEVVTIGNQSFIAYSAAAFRSPDDPCPGIGVAWEPFPGKTPYTKDSELMNAETSAWGRAIIAVGAADAKKGIATQEDVRNRSGGNTRQSGVAAVKTVDLTKHIKATLDAAEQEMLKEAWVADGYNFKAWAVPQDKEAELRVLIDSFVGVPMPLGGDNLDAAFEGDV